MFHRDASSLFHQGLTLAGLRSARWASAWPAGSNGPSRSLRPPPAFSCDTSQTRPQPSSLPLSWIPGKRGCASRESETSTPHSWLHSQCTARRGVACTIHNCAESAEAEERRHRVPPAAASGRGSRTLSALSQQEALPGTRGRELQTVEPLPTPAGALPPRVLGAQGSGESLPPRAASPGPAVRQHHPVVSEWRWGAGRFLLLC